MFKYITMCWISPIICFTLIYLPNNPKCIVHSSACPMYFQVAKLIDYVGFIPQVWIPGKHVERCIDMCDIQIHHDRGNIQKICNVPITCDVYYQYYLWYINSKACPIYFRDAKLINYVRFILQVQTPGKHVVQCIGMCGNRLHHDKAAYTKSTISQSLVMSITNTIYDTSTVIDGLYDNQWYSNLYANDALCASCEMHGHNVDRH